MLALSSKSSCLGLRSSRPRVAAAPGRGAVVVVRRSPPMAAGEPTRPTVAARALNFSKGPELPERILASLPYLLPLLDTLPYGRFLFLQYPYIARALAPLAPLNALYHAFPLAPFIIFLGVYSGIVANPNLSRYVRYNASQAVLLDILLIIPQVLLDAFGRPGLDGSSGLGLGGGLGSQVYVAASNTLFLFIAVCAAYGMGACAVGQTPRLPLVASAADSQIRDGPSGF